MKVWLLTNTPSPYQLEFLTSIDRRTDCSLSVRLMDREHRGQAASLDGANVSSLEVMRGVGPRIWSDAFRIHPQAIREACCGAFDVFVLSGQYTSITSMCCVLALRLRHRPFVFWLEQPWPDDYRPAWSRSIASRHGWARAVRKRVLSKAVRAADRVFGIGTAAVQAYERLGVRPDRLINMPYHCDVQRFEHVDGDRVSALRTRLHADKHCVFLFSGQLIERKGVDVLIAAFEQLPDEAMLLILGDGPLRGPLEERVSDGARGRIHIAGHVEQADMPVWFAVADVFVFPSRHDGWGVVLNEACAAGLPIVVTKSTGAAADLVVDGVNGYLVDRDDVGALQRAMSDAMSDPAKRKRYGDASRDRVRRFSLEEGASRFCAALGEITETGSS